MKSSKLVLKIGLCYLIVLSACSSNSERSNADMITINLQKMKHIGSVDERFQSYNVEMVEVVGGDFWKPYKFMDSLPSLEAIATYDVSQKDNPLYRKLSPINLADKRLVNLAKGLAPAYVRVSGT